MIYGYRCRECGQTRDSSGRDDVQRCGCGGLSKRDYSSVQLSPAPFQAHYNNAVGRYVSNRREFEDALKKSSDTQSERVGMDHDYQPIYPSDMKSMEPKVETQALEESNKGWQDKRGRKPNALSK